MPDLPRVSRQLLDDARAVVSLAAATHPDELSGYVVIHTLPEIPERPLVYGPFDDDVPARQLAAQIEAEHDDADGPLGTVVVSELLHPGR